MSAARAETLTDSIGPKELERILAGMSAVVALMESYRARIEAIGFSRAAAEAMTVHYHAVICNEMDRIAAANRAADRVVDPMGAFGPALSSPDREVGQSGQSAADGATACP